MLKDKYPQLLSWIFVGEVQTTHGHRLKLRCFVILLHFILMIFLAGCPQRARGRRRFVRPRKTELFWLQGRATMELELMSVISAWGLRGSVLLNELFKSPYSCWLST